MQEKQAVVDRNGEAGKHMPQLRKMDLWNGVLDSLRDCPICKKAKCNDLTFLCILGGAAGLGTITMVLFALGGQYVGLEMDRIVVMMKLEMIAGATTYLCWVLWQYEKLMCKCEEGDELKKKTAVEKILKDIPYAKMGKHGVKLELDLSKRAPEKPKETQNNMYR